MPSAQGLLRKPLSFSGYNRPVSRLPPFLLVCLVVLSPAATEGQDFSLRPSLEALVPVPRLSLAVPQPQPPIGPEQEEPAVQAEPSAQEEPAADVPAEAEPPGAREGYLPKLDVFFPEGDLDLRVNRLVNKVFFEGQVKYNFIEGDITAFLRYRYYGYQRTFQLTAFDAVEFDGIEELSDEFSRVRGLLGLIQWPHNYHFRTFLLAEIDRLISNKEELELTNNQTNTFVRLGYQIGTPRDARSNALVGESRARIEQLFTPFREIGPRGAGLTIAGTYAFDLGLGDFDYVKLEAEALKRFALPGKNFLIGRLHAGSFPVRDRCEDEEAGTPCAELPDLEEADRLSIPRNELFRLDGRENLKGLSEGLRGTHELHTTWELFLPWFLDRSHRALGLEWNNWYWVLYGGVGNIGFDTGTFLEPSDYIPDVGVGFESSFRLRKYQFFLSGLLAHALNGQGDVEARVSVKSYR